MHVDLVGHVPQHKVIIPRIYYGMDLSGFMIIKSADRDLVRQTRTHAVVE